MTTVRPPVWPQVGAASTGAQRPADSAKMAAQRAFFEAALGRAPTAQPAQPSPPARIAEPAPPIHHATPVRPIPIDDDQPRKILRPGSLLNILV